MQPLMHSSDDWKCQKSPLTFGGNMAVTHIWVLCPGIMACCSLLNVMCLLGFAGSDCMNMKMTTIELLDHMIWRCLQIPLLLCKLTLPRYLFLCHWSINVRVYCAMCETCHLKDQHQTAKFQADALCRLSVGLVRFVSWPDVVWCEKNCFSVSSWFLNNKRSLKDSELRNGSGVSIEKKQYKRLVTVFRPPEVICHDGIVINNDNNNHLYTAIIQVNLR